jgi:molybdopterin converting factor subunit 1
LRSPSDFESVYWACERIFPGRGSVRGSAPGLTFPSGTGGNTTFLMKIKVLFFGLTRDLTGLGEERVELQDGERLQDLWQRYANRFPKLAEMSQVLVTAVNQEVAGPTRALRDGDEVAFLPPVSGGAPEDFYRLTREVIRTHELADALKAPEDGATVVFEGIVRNHSKGKKTLFLEYEAYEPMVLRKMEEIGFEVKKKFTIDRVGMIHRIGRLEIGETSVAIIVTSAHRAAAFEACRYAIDRLKQIVPIWKKEYFEDGAVWAEGEGQTRVLAEPRGK